MSANQPPAPAARICAACRAELAPALLACPSCGQLVHSDALKRLAVEGEGAERAGDIGRALAAWRQALAFLPAGAGQHTRIQEKVQALSGVVSSSPSGAAPAAGAGAPRTGWRRWAAGAGAGGVVLLKFKWVLLFLLTKAKVLLVGLTQAKTFLSMAVMIGVYTTIYGWRFAFGIVISLYIHEMGHVVWLRRFGIPATAPMFIPGFGAFVRLKAQPATVGEDARVGLAGPVWGAGAAVIALALGFASGLRVLLGVAYFGAVINAFNLLPVWQLDGGRAFKALSRGQRGIVAGVLWAAALTGASPMFFLVAIAATFRAAAAGSAPPRGDRNVLLTFLALVVGLAAIMLSVGKI